MRRISIDLTLDQANDLLYLVDMVVARENPDTPRAQSIAEDVREKLIKKIGTLPKQEFEQWSQKSSYRAT